MKTNTMAINLLHTSAIDMTLKESVRATMLSKVRRLFAKFDYPPDHKEKAIELMLQQAELFAAPGNGSRRE